MNEALISEFTRNEGCSDAADYAPLRPVVWSELTARLAAMRDLRRSLAGGSRLAAANFSSLKNARPHMASAFGEFTGPRAGPSDFESGVNTDLPGINPIASADRKRPASNSSVEPNCVNPGD